MAQSLKEFVSKVENFNSLNSSKQIDYFAYYYTIVLNFENFKPKQIKDAFVELRLNPYSNVPRYLMNNSNKALNKPKQIKFLKFGTSYHLESKYELILNSKIQFEKESSFINFEIDESVLDWKPSDIPFINGSLRKNAKFFTTLYYLFYHLENSIRRFLKSRLVIILGDNWDSQICGQVDLSKAQSIRKETNLSEMIDKRGDSILHYCMWDDYSKIIQEYPKIINNVKESNEILAHLSSLGKIRNAIAHNTNTIPKEYQDELTLFIKKYIKIMKNK